MHTKQQIPDCTCTAWLLVWCMVMGSVHDELKLIGTVVAVVV